MRRETAEKKGRRRNKKKGLVFMLPDDLYHPLNFKQKKLGGKKAE